MTLKGLFIMPDSDEATAAGFYHISELAKEAGALGVDVTTLEKDKARKAPIQEAVLRLKEGSIHLVGHGNPKVITGQYKEIVIDATNVKQFDSFFVMAISCSVAKGEGSLASMFKHAVAFNEDVVFVTSSDHTRDRPFFDSWGEVTRSFWVGKSRNQAVEAARKKAEAYMKTMPPLDAGYLRLDMDALGACGWGDPNEAISSIKGIESVTITTIDPDNTPSSWEAKLAPMGTWKAVIPAPKPGKYLVTVTAMSETGVSATVAWEGPVIVPEPAKPIVKILDVQAKKGRIEVEAEARLPE